MYAHSIIGTVENYIFRDKINVFLNKIKFSIKRWFYPLRQTVRLTSNCTFFSNFAALCIKMSHNASHELILEQKLCLRPRKKYIKNIRAAMHSEIMPDWRIEINYWRQSQNKIPELLINNLVSIKYKTCHFFTWNVQNWRMKRGIYLVLSRLFIIIKLIWKCPEPLLNLMSLIREILVG